MCWASLFWTPIPPRACTRRMRQPPPPLALVFLSALFTGLNLYHRLARYGGAGTLVPITGFANAVVSPAIDFKTEVRCIIGIVRENRNR